MALDGVELNSWDRECCMKMGDEVEPWQTAWSAAQSRLVGLGTGLSCLALKPLDDGKSGDEMLTSSVDEGYTFPPIPPPFEAVEGLKQQPADRPPTAEKEPAFECNEGLNRPQGPSTFDGGFTTSQLEHG